MPTNEVQVELDVTPKGQERDVKKTRGGKDEPGPGGEPIPSGEWEKTLSTLHALIEERD